MMSRGFSQLPELVWLLALLCLPALLTAQNKESQPKGGLKGSVMDGSTQDPVVGATVQLLGTYSGANTSTDGSYLIEGVKPGDYTVQVTLLGYAKKKITGVRIKANQTITLNITLTPKEMTTEEVEIVGKKTLIDLEGARSQHVVSQDEIKDMQVSNVEDLAAMQTGVAKTPDGLQIRGGRIYETQYLVDGVSAQDPLAGTGFGLDVGSNAISEMSVITGGAGAEYGGGTAGVVSTKIREGGDKFQISGEYERDNVGINKNQGASWNSEKLELSMGGPFPFLKDKLKFFFSGSVRMHDTYFRARADQLESSIMSNDELLAPRQDNRMSQTAKIAYTPKPGLKITLSSQNSVSINQNNNSLQIVGNNEVVTPGFQFTNSLNMDNANTFTHTSNLNILRVKAALSDRWAVSFHAGMLNTQLRADANGRPFRDSTDRSIKDPASVVTDPISIFQPNDSLQFVNAPSGLVNNGGLATLWHDHYVAEYTGRVKFSYQPKNEVHYLTLGWEHIEKDYQWIDVTRPWVGAPIRLNDSTTFSSNRIGTSNDIWQVRPAQGSFFVSDKIDYKGIIANIGLRSTYWAPGEFAENAINDPDAPVVDEVRENFKEETSNVLGRRHKMRLLPKINVSFPVTENNVLYFNYSHALRMPHPRFLYAGLDPVFQDRSFLSNLGNPNLDPETSVNYELGLKTQFNRNTALTVVAYNNDKFDYIVNRRIEIRDQTGRFTQRSFFINQDFARIRGLEVTLNKRYGDWFIGTFSMAYQVATGKSNSARESELQIQQQGRVETTEEFPLAWDRPIDLKANAIFRLDSTYRPFHNFRIFVSATYKSGLRYTPHIQTGVREETGRPEFEPDPDRRLEKVGEAWHWVDVRVARNFYFDNSRQHFIQLFMAVENIFDIKNAAIVNPVTGEGYRSGDPLPITRRNPEFPNPLASGPPPNNPSRWLKPRHILFGARFKF